MRNQIIALEYKPYGMISVSIPIPVLKILGRFSVDDKITGGIVVKTANNIK